MSDPTTDWSRLKDAFAEIADLPAGKRARALRRLARADAGLAERVTALLAADDEAGRRLERFELLSDDARGSAPDAAAEPIDMLGLVGTTVAHFRVLDVLGAGGMGVAYRAEDVRLGRTVALKFLRPQLALDADAKRRFMHEARTASALDHPNVCTLLEIGESEHGPFLAMPAYPGETLRERLARERRIPPTEAIGIARQLLEGLSAAHAAGITHRDLKPGNIVITTDGTVKILDFGLATGYDLPLSAEPGQAGTVAYMSPERLGGSAGDVRSDLWSVGVLLYEMLVGQRPFGANRDLLTVHAVLHDTPPAPSALDPAVPSGLDAVVTRLLEKDPDARFGSAHEVLAALDSLTLPAAGSDRSTMRRLIPAAAVLLVLAGAVAVPLIRGAMDTGRATTLEQGSIAVIPFVDASPAQDQAHLGEGVAEEILNALAAVPGLRVPARGSSFRFTGSDVPTAEIGRRLGVATVLDGSVLRDGARVRVTARLLDVASDRTLWTQTFDEPFRNLLETEKRIARTVASEMRVRLDASAVGAAAAPNMAAYELYLRGVFHWNRRTTQDLRQAMDFFTQATQHDSTFARPYAGLALSYVVLSILDPGSADLLARTHDAAARALALDSTLADAHAARGYAFHWQWQWADAERELQRAIALNPSYATAREWYGEHLAQMGRGAEAEVEVKRAIALDPLSLVAQNDLGIVYFVSGRLDEAIAQLERVRRIDPAFPLPLLLLHRVHLAAGHIDDAAEQGRRWAEITDAVDPGEIVLLSLAVRDTTRRPAARAILARRERSPAPPWPEIAMYYALIGDRDGAVRALERGLAARSPMLVQIGHVPWLDPLRDDPDVRRIIGALGFP